MTGAGKGTQGIGGGAAESQESDAIAAVRALAEQPVGSETQEEEGTGGGAANELPDDFELREDTVDQLPQEIQGKARMILAREAAWQERVALDGQQETEETEEEEVQEYDYNVALDENLEGVDQYKAVFKQMGEHFDERLRVIERRERELNKQVALTSASQDLQDFRASNPDYKQYEQGMLEHAKDAPTLLDTKAGLNKLLKLAKADDLERQVREGRIDKQAATRAGGNPRFESKSQRSREVLPGRAESLEEAMRMAAKQMNAEGLL